MPDLADAADVKDAARQASHSDAMGWGARAGLAARGVIYLLLGVLALAIALGRTSSGKEADQRGALQELAQHSGGKALLVLLAIGFAAYALWRFTGVAFGVPGDGNGKGPRLKALVSGLVYLSFAISSVSVLAGSSGSQARQQQGLTAKVMAHSGGRWLVGLVGLVVLAVGAVMVYEGVKRKFEKYLRTGEMSARTRTVVTRLGMVGTIARGVVIGLSGLLVVDAAVSYDPKKARGLDGALKTLAAQSYGEVLLGLIALGLVAFGVYGLAESRWRRTE